MLLRTLVWIKNFLSIMLISVMVFAQQNPVGSNLPKASLNDLKNENSQALVMQLPSEKNGAITITAESLGDMSSKEVNALVARVSDERDAVVASDMPQVLKGTSETILKANQKKGSKHLLRFMPMGMLSSMSDKARDEYRNYLNRAQETLRKDKMTVILLSITVGIDSYVWVQATSLDFPQKLSMLSMNLLIALTFGLDRELWGAFTTPIQNKIIGLFDHLSKSTTENVQRGKVLAAQFASNFIAGSSLFFMRHFLLSFEQLHDTVTSMPFWSQSLKLSAAATLTQFAWSELYVKTNELTNPVAKLNLKRITDIRYVVLSLFASMSMVMQPAQYGHTPLITYIIHGAIGFYALMKAPEIINFLEANLFSKKVFKYSVKFEDFLNSFFEKKSRSSFRCEALFSP